MCVCLRHDKALLRIHPFKDDVFMHPISSRYSGICHSDVHMMNEDWGKNVYPFVPGHEIVGKVSALGSHVTKFSKGQTVAVGK
jgi:uncharacterized zinc-type alcohol dehydrogenase-like protein